MSRVRVIARWSATPVSHSAMAPSRYRASVIPYCATRCQRAMSTIAADGRTAIQKPKAYRSIQLVSVRIRSGWTMSRENVPATASADTK